uniref:G patch domain-containing protein 3-like n=1 Tax=Saccoglossus kowalevskii TaxID=10224 RepID=A0ABM0MPF6_SACKO|nr:PREDICTED: G patch domain-containing protein 3-like [Saccoglossus kowalevskii]
MIGNIPGNFHSADLRNYFSQFIESGGFNCFHFRHRPEVKSRSHRDNSSDGNVQNEIDVTSTSSLKRDPKNSDNTLCCVVKLSSHNADKLIKMYNGKRWIGKDGSLMASRCRITRVKVNKQDSSTSQYKTRKEEKTIPSERETFTENDLSNLIELKPPAIMPNGNVGTPTKYFLDLIRACRMPPSMIKKLGLSFPKTRSNRRYGNVPFNYPNSKRFSNNEQEETVLTGSGEEIIFLETQNTGDIGVSRTIKEEGLVSDKRNLNKVNSEIDDLADDQEQELSESDQDDDTCEDWERHEALHNDVTEQDRTKERLYEDEIELKWEKGGPGLVFYTDAYYWKQQEGDFDEQTADDWDVDMSVYYDLDGGDKDARDYVQMRLEQRRRDGIPDDADKIGKFEKHTKGIGRKILVQQGWKDGEGLGASVSGITAALENDGQHPRERKGLGYYGEKINRNVKKTKKRRAEDGIITTIYDNPLETDQPDTLLRSQHPWTLKYRPDVKFCKGHDDDSS